MIKYILRRLVNLIPVLLIISIILFAMNEAMPGSPIDQLMPRNIKSEQQRMEIRKALEDRYNLNGTLVERYIGWLGRILRGELGESIKYQRPVGQVVRRPLLNTLILNLGSTIIAFFLSSAK